MSDQHDGEHDDEALLSGLAELDDDRASAAGMPALAGRIEGVHGTLSTLGMRLDALVSSTTSYRSTLTERLNEYSELVARLTRAQAADLEEYRRANERTFGELRRSLANTEGALERLVAQVEEVSEDAGASDGQTRKLLAEVRSILDAQDRLGGAVDEALEQLGVSLTERQGEAQRELLASLESIRAAVTSSQQATDALTEKVAAPQVRAGLDELRNEMQSLRRSVLEWPDLLTVKEQVAGVRADLGDLLERATSSDATDADVSRLLSDVTETVGRVEARLGDGELSEQLDIVVARLAEIETAIDPNERLDAVTARLGEIQQTLAGQDPSVRLEAIERQLDDSVSGAIRALRDQVSSQDPAPTVSRATDVILEEVRASNQVATQTWTEVSSLRGDIERAAGSAEQLAPVLAQIDVLTETVAGLATAEALTEQGRSLTDALGDVAAGEVVASLWDEIYALRQSVESGLAVDGPSALEEDLAALRAAVERLVGEPVAMPSVEDIPPPPPPPDTFDGSAFDEPGLDAATPADVPPPPPPPPVDATAASAGPATSLAAIAAELAALRTDVVASAARDEVSRLVAEVDGLRAELGEGLVVEPSDTLTESLTALDRRLDELSDGLAALEQLRVAAPDDGDESAEDDDEAVGPTAADLAEEMASLRDTVQSLLDRIDLEDEWEDVDDDRPEPPPPPPGFEDDRDEAVDAPDDSDYDDLPPPPPPPAEVVVADELAALRADLDEVLEAVRGAGFAAAADSDGADEELRSQLDAVRADLADTTGAIRALMEDGVPIDEPAAGGLDQETLDNLVAEIRSAGSVSDDLLDNLVDEIRSVGAVRDDLLDQLRQELGGIRKRLAVKAKDDPFTDEQVGQVADAVDARQTTTAQEIVDLLTDKVDRTGEDIVAAIEQRQQALADQLSELTAALDERTALTPEQLDQIADTIAARFEIADD